MLLPNGDHKVLLGEVLGNVGDPPADFAPVDDFDLLEEQVDVLLSDVDVQLLESVPEVVFELAVVPLEPLYLGLLDDVEFAEGLLLLLHDADGVLLLCRPQVRLGLLAADHGLALAVLRDADSGELGLFDFVEHLSALGDALVLLVEQVAHLLLVGLGVRLVRAELQLQGLEVARKVLDQLLVFLLVFEEGGLKELGVAEGELDALELLGVLAEELALALDLLEEGLDLGGLLAAAEVVGLSSRRGTWVSWLTSDSL